MPDGPRIVITVIPEFLGARRERIRDFCRAVEERLRELHPGAAVTCRPSTWADTVVSGADPDEEERLREEVAEAVTEVFEDETRWAGPETAPETSPDTVPETPPETLREAGAPGRGEEEPPEPATTEQAMPEPPLAEPATSPAPARPTPPREPEPADPLASALLFRSRSVYYAFFPGPRLGLMLSSRSKGPYSVTRFLPEDPTDRAAYRSLYGDLGRDLAAAELPPDVADRLRDLLAQETGAKPRETRRKKGAWAS